MKPFTRAEIKAYSFGVRYGTKLSIKEWIAAKKVLKKTKMCLALALFYEAPKNLTTDLPHGEKHVQI